MDPKARLPQAISQRVNPGWQALKTPDLRWLWAGQVISQIGEGLSKVALMWLVYTLSGSTLKMSLIGVLQTVPPLVLGPLLGVYIDRFPKKRLMIAVDLTRSALAVVIPILYDLEELTPFTLYLVVFIMAVVSTVFGPALFSTVPLIVQEAQLTAANALVNSTAMIGMLIGPAVSGLGIATIGTENVLYVNGGTFLLSVLCLTRLKIPPRDTRRAQSRQEKSFWQDLRDGIRFVFVKHPTILGFATAALIFSLASGAFIFLLPVFADKSLSAGPILLGWLWAAYGAGMVLVTGWLAFSRQRSAPQRLLIVAGVLAAGSVASFALTQIRLPFTAAGLVAVIGASLAGFTPVAWGILQELTPEKLRGRVFAIFNTGAMSSAIIGMVAFGWTTDRLGPQTSLMGMAVILLLTGAAAAFLSRRGNLEPKPTG